MMEAYFVPHFEAGPPVKTSLLSIDLHYPLISDQISEDHPRPLEIPLLISIKISAPSGSKEASIS